MDVYSIMFGLRKKVNTLVWSLRKYRQPFNPDKLLQSLNNKDHKNTLLNKIHALEQERKEKEEAGSKSVRPAPPPPVEPVFTTEIIPEDSTANHMPEINWNNVEEPIDYKEEWNRNSLVEAITKGKAAMKYILDNYDVWK